MQMSMRLTYKDLERVLAALHGVEEKQRIALQGRIKHFQRNSWPGGTNTGKGKAASYGFGETVKLVLGFELLEIGLTPERSTKLLRNNWDYICTALSLAFHENRGGSVKLYDVILYCDPSSLNGLLPLSSAHDDPADDTFFYTSTSEMSRALIEAGGLGTRRLAVINLSLLLTSLAVALGVSWDLFKGAYEEWDQIERPVRDLPDERGNILLKDKLR